MKKYISLAAGLVLLASACTPTTPVTENTTTTTSTTTTTKTEQPTSSPKADQKTDTAANADGWQDYKSSTGKFSVQVPSKPQEQSQDQATDVGTIKLNMVIAEANDSGYFVGYADFPNEISNPVDIQKGLAESVKGSVSNLKGEVKSEKESLLGNIPCRDFEAAGKVQATDVLMKGRFCLSGKRLYQVFTLGSAEKMVIADVDRFIASFKVDK
ncbi:hypothetical protein [Pseudanabaena mucicola]|uniref:Lipoprotein n=1 Tax=Pseudanabaena mucicola FACHB-723 TaxID=2692860 RepID=A0ABR7ZUI0_9CYAN|nr:hypothetical protein [Pseudanabaena mucicola]MBD2187145.1 hypothetical protein [Pseudanabaena mucicola FACHB-723]